MIVASVRYLGQYRLEVLFDDGEVRIADFQQFLFQDHSPMTTQFRDMNRFKKVSIDSGHLTWENGQMDISATSIYSGDFDQHNN